MGVEVWFRNPHNYIKELVEVGAVRIAWDRGAYEKKNIDPLKHARLYYGQAYEWELLLIGTQGAAHYTDENSFYSPKAVYPVWQYGEDFGLLEELMENPVGDEPQITGDTTIPGDERAVAGQEHRIVITNLPIMSSSPARAFITRLKELNEEYPEAKLHIHALYSWRIMFGVGFHSVDVDPRTSAQKGKVLLPHGKERSYEIANAEEAKWVRMIGYKPVDLAEPRIRCMFNIESAVWAGENYGGTVAMRQRKSSTEVDTTTPAAQYAPPSTSTPHGRAVAAPGDKVTCDTCSLSGDCTAYRSGAVCSLKGSEGATFIDMVGSRDSNRVLDGMSEIVKMNARRLQRGMTEESALGDLNPEVTKVMNQVFDQSERMAKLIDPSLRASAAKVQVNVGSMAPNGQPVGVIPPRQVVTDIIREFENQGYQRNEITKEMITGAIEAMNRPDEAHRVIEAGRVLEA